MSNSLWPPLDHVAHNMAVTTAPFLGVVPQRVSLERLGRPRTWPSQWILYLWLSKLVPVTPKGLPYLTLCLVPTLLFQQTLQMPALGQVSCWVLGIQK